MQIQPRFKFRFWHKPTNKMLNCYGYNEYFVFADTLDGIGTEYNPANFQDCILMQCTGLKDKNGKLIYEGDILISDDYEPYMITVNWIKNEAKFDIFAWNSEEFEYKLSDDEMDDLKYFEIIGNIYENSELLN